MKVEVKIISKEIVKPSSPTPQHLRHYYLSYLDQMSPQVNISMVYFFVADASNPFNASDASNRLKKSLSQVLTHYYPLAGRLVDKKFVDCNDEGALYLEARVIGSHLSHVIHNPTPADVTEFLPFQMDEAMETLLGVQFNAFDCGGIAIGACISHKVADAMSFVQFIKSWAAMSMTRGEADVSIRAHFQSSTLFPPRDMFGYNPEAHIAKDDIVTKRFVFNASAIESLKARYGERMVAKGQKPPSRVEALSTFLWRRFITATEVKCGRPHLVGYAVNIRGRMEPTLPDYAFGNYVCTATIMFPSPWDDDDDDDDREYEVVRQLREHLKKIPKLQQEGQLIVNPVGRGLKVGTVPFGVTSWCWFPVYEVDFGWGNPTWVGSPTWKFKNVIILRDTKSGRGIEAYVSLTEQDMAKFECDQELLALLSGY